MKFHVVQTRSDIPQTGDPGTAYLWADNWDDFGYKTLYTLTCFDSNREPKEVGPLKIGRSGMKDELGRPGIPNSFQTLKPDFFSLGQDPNYYSNLMALESSLRRAILEALNDIAFDPNLYEHASAEHVTTRSLMRFVARRTIQEQYRRILDGGAALTEYRFEYTGPGVEDGDAKGIHLAFEVTPNSRPPSNIHVLVGRNGVGKTRLLSAMSRALLSPSPDPETDGRFLTNDSFSLDDAIPFANLVSVSFSAFDDFHHPPQRHDESTTIRHAAVGLQKHRRNQKGEWVTRTCDPKELAENFAVSASACISDMRYQRWRDALTTLESDPLFAESQVSSLLDHKEEVIKKSARHLYRQLSSGHKIVLLTITKLVETVEEKTLVLIDEPEAHLHPPLLAAFVRALSDLLINRNGVAILATHSPVVLQEVPRSCVWKIIRHGRETHASRPEIETFAESVGILTKEVFGLEVTRSGFHKMLQEHASDAVQISDVLECFDNEVGTEGRSLVSSILSNQPKNY
jgi:predicted ATPase